MRLGVPRPELDDPRVLGSSGPAEIEGGGLDMDRMSRYLDASRDAVLDEIRAIVPREARDSGQLYELMLDYPLRYAKALRPALCIATCRALGGRLQGVLRSAAVLELYHNAFLIHDDVEDDSELRRNEQTLHRAHGVPIAVNVGDGMLALALQPLLDNMRFIGMGKALRVLQTVGEMARATAEGQAMELEWIRDGRWDQTDQGYVRMVYKKSAWYSFLTPIALGALSADAAPAQLGPLRRFAILLGVAFQIQDDVLNLTGQTSAYGKEIAGDLWEGKHTLILLRTLRRATPAERQRAEGILRRPRPPVPSADASLRALLDQLVADGELTPGGRDRLWRDARPSTAEGGPPKTPEEVAWLHALVDRYDGIAYARAFARARAERARRVLAGCSEWLRPSVHTRFLHSMVDFVVERER
ncbi:MAG: polyprenyl synthetase family protein [Myxococcota bacterium]